MFGNSAHQLDPVRSYADAARRYEEITPVRGHTVRPLGRRSDHTKRIEKSGGAYAFVLHRTDVVTWVSSTALVIRTWNSNLTIDFANRFLPSDISAFSYRGHMAIRVRGEEYRGGTLFFELRDGRWEYVSGAQQETENRLDLKKAAATRKKLKPFKDWSEAIRQLSGQNVNYAIKVSDIEALLADPTNPELFTRMAPFGLPGKTMQSLTEAAYAADNALASHDLPLGALPKVDAWNR